MKRNKIIIWILSITLILSLSFGACAIYLSDHYRADDASITAFSQNFDITISNIDRAITYGTGDEDTAFIFYPGGKVEHTAYAPLMLSLAEKGVFCVLVEMPFNLAVLDINAAEDIRSMYPEIDDWYIGGHSLGGSMAASHLSSNTEKYKGLVLLGSYSTADISDTDIDVISLYGSEDNVMNREKYNKYRSNLPSDFYDIEIKGGCHAYFGMYGEQDGDGVANISAEEQIFITANSIYEIILRGKTDAQDN